MGGFLSDLKAEPNPEVYNASCGPLKGNIYKHNEKIIHGYLGIPYAKPAIRELRFKKPEPAELWSDPLDCTKYGPRAPQVAGFIDLGGNNIPDSEDGCLTLNIFQPQWSSTEFKNKRPVMFFIHGGGYELSSSADYHDYSLSGTLPLNDVIVVTINYRLGALGFLTTGDETCRGNFGLWDQTLALKWVRKHISSFGGDADNVTVFGQSAGGASTDLLSLSPHSRDLFHKMVLMSGSSGCHFAIRTARHQAKIFREFAAFLGYTGSQESSQILEFYQSQSAKNLGKVTSFRKSVSGFLNFTPNLDGDFFPKSLEELRKEAPTKIIMAGVCEFEGLMLALMDPSFTTAKRGFERQLEVMYGSDVVENPEEYRKSIWDHYIKGVNENDEHSMKKKLVEFVGDAFFNHGVLDSVKSATRNGNHVYLYGFEYCNPENFGMFDGLIPFKAATHCTELRYLLGDGVYSKFEPNPTDFEMIRTFTRFFSNFAKYGNPNEANSVEWRKYSLKHPNQYFRISVPECAMRGDYQSNRCQIYDDLKEKSLWNKEIIEDSNRSRI